jgi:hypothetical protein
MTTQSDRVFDDVQAQYDRANQLLTEAKAAKLAWHTWETDPEGWKRDGWKIPYRTNEDAWNALIQAIGQMPKPLFFTGEDGVERTIGTQGLTSGDLMMDYAPEVGAAFVAHGYALDRVQYFGVKTGHE